MRALARAARPAVRAATLVALVAAGAACGSGSTPRSALLVSVDGVSPDRLGCYGCPEARTPLWDRMARRGAQFRSAFSSSPRTLPATGTLLSGAHPFTHGARRNGDPFDPPGLTLAEALTRGGNRCGAVLASAELAGKAGLARGFERFAPAEGAESACDAAQAWITGLESENGYFLFLHLEDPAPPGDAPSPWNDVLPDSLDAGIAATDRALARLFLRLGELGRLDRSLVAITSDRGSGPGAPALDDTFLRVPLALWGPLPYRGGHLREDPALLVDVLPTLLAAFRIGPDWRLPGRSLDVTEPDDPVEPYAELFPEGADTPLRAMRTGDWQPVERPAAEAAEAGRS